MLKRVVLASVIAAVFGAATLGAATGVSLAQDAAPPATKKVAKAKAAKVAPVPKGKVVVDNQRNATLNELIVTPSGGAPVTIAKDLPGGQKVTVPLPKKMACVVTISGSFDDESEVDVPSQNLCKDGRITLVE